MAALQGPNLGVNYGWSVRESGWHTGMDANLKLLDAVPQLFVDSRSVATPPGAPAVVAKIRCWLQGEWKSEAIACEAIR